MSEDTMVSDGVMATWEEVQQALPHLSTAAHAELSMLVMRNRLETALNENHRLRQAVADLEKKVDEMAGMIADQPRDDFVDPGSTVSNS